MILLINDSAFCWILNFWICLYSLYCIQLYLSQFLHVFTQDTIQVLSNWINKFLICFSQFFIKLLHFFGCCILIFYHRFCIRAYFCLYWSYLHACSHVFLFYWVKLFFKIYLIFCQLLLFLSIIFYVCTS